MKCGVKASPRGQARYSYLISYSDSVIPSLIIAGQGGEGWPLERCYFRCFATISCGTGAGASTAGAVDLFEMADSMTSKSSNSSSSQSHMMSRERWCEYIRISHAQPGSAAGTGWWSRMLHFGVVFAMGDGSCSSSFSVRWIHWLASDYQWPPSIEAKEVPHHLRNQPTAVRRGIYVRILCGNRAVEVARKKVVLSKEGKARVHNC